MQRDGCHRLYFDGGQAHVGSNPIADTIQNREIGSYESYVGTDVLSDGLCGLE